MRFRKKPLVIEAEQWLGPPESFIGDDQDYILPMDILWKGKEKNFFIKTLEGDCIITPMDWIITGIKGERYPCKPDVFAMSYDFVPEIQKEAASTPVATG